MNSRCSSSLSPDSVVCPCLRSSLASATTCSTSHRSTWYHLLQHCYRSRHACVTTATHLAHPLLGPGLSAALQGLLGCAIQADLEGLPDQRDGFLLLDVRCPDCRPWVGSAHLSIAKLQHNPPARGMSVFWEGLQVSPSGAPSDPADFGLR